MRGKKFYGGMILVLLIAGVGIPAGFGFVQEKVVELGVNDLLDTSANWDDSNIVNSTYFLKEEVQYWDNSSDNKYKLDIVYDESNNLDIAMADTSGTVVNTWSGEDFVIYHLIKLNKTKVLENVDKIVVKYRILDDATADLQDAIIKYYATPQYASDHIDYKEYNATDAVNQTLNIELTLDAIKRLKLSSYTTDYLAIVIELHSSSPLTGIVDGYRVDVYDTIKVDSNMICNAMLAVSGFVMTIGAFAATPFWNPTHPESRTRRVLGKLRRRR